MTRRRILAGTVVLLLAMVAAGSLRATGWEAVVRGAIFGKKTVIDRLEEFAPEARSRWSPHFARAGAMYPPARVTLVGLKAEKRLDVYATGAADGLVFIRSYPILAASGGPGPKLKRGDRQVPEGVYPIESLNPNSRFHVALRIGYPNDFDRRRAAADGRTDLGSDIMIHGSNASVGCLAMGDEAAKDLFTLAAEAGVANVSFILAPYDLRAFAPSAAEAIAAPPWYDALRVELLRALEQLPPPSILP